MLKTRIKANCINNLTDARYFSARGANWLTYDMDKASADYLEPAKLMAITGWVEGPKTVAKFNNQTIEEIKDLKKLIDFDVAEMGMKYSIQDIMGLEGIKVQKTIVVTPGLRVEDLESEMSPYIDLVDCYILDFQKYKMSWNEFFNDPPFSISILKDFCKNNNVILDIPFEANETSQILDEMKPHGLCVAGGMEEKIGMKSYDELDDVFDLLEEN